MDQNDFRIEVEGEKAYVYAPYYPQFNRKMKRMGGSFDHLKKCWVVKSKNEVRVRKAMHRSFGCDDQCFGELVTVMVKVKENIRKSRTAVCLYGKVLAEATGRDSNANPGEDVGYVEGFCTSGGSRNYWVSLVAAGSVIKLLDVQREIVEKTVLPEGVEVEILPRVFDCHETSKTQGSVAVDNPLSIVVEGEIAKIYTPKHYGFRQDLKWNMRVKWNSKEKCWIVKAGFVDIVRNLMKDHFGHDDLSLPQKVSCDN